MDSYMVGGWALPFWKIWFNWDDDIPKIRKIKNHPCWDQVLVLGVRFSNLFAFFGKRQMLFRRDLVSAHGSVKLCSLLTAKPKRIWPSYVSWRFMIVLGVWSVLETTVTTPWAHKLGDSLGSWDCQVVVSKKAGWKKRNWLTESNGQISSQWGDSWGPPRRYQDYRQPACWEQRT